MAAPPHPPNLLVSAAPREEALPHPSRLAAIATAVPEHVLRRDEVARAARAVFAGRLRDFDRLAAVYENAGIEQRFSCVPLAWYAKPRAWAERMRLYGRHATALGERAARDCLGLAGIEPGQVDAIVFVSTTGVATPSLDAVLAGRLGLRPTVERLPVFGLGCAGGVLGLARAAALARARPGSRVLLVVAELCGLTFRPQDASKSNLIATALFGDGAAAVLLDGAAGGPRVTAWGEHLWPQSLDVMGWRIEDDGFGVLFSRDIPTIIRNQMPPVVADFLARNGLARADIDGFLCHPGGAKVVTALEEALELPGGTLAVEREVLRTHGNMSAATVLFVLARALKDGLRGRHLMSALGPGFTAGLLVLEGA